MYGLDFDDVPLPTFDFFTAALSFYYYGNVAEDVGSAGFDSFPLAAGVLKISSVEIMAVFFGDSFLL